MKPARLKVYYNYLGNFDFVDKELQFSKSLAFDLNLFGLNIWLDSDKCQLSENALTKGLILEIFSNQKIEVKNLEKILLKNLFFMSTLRKENLFLFLDTCLNTVFLYKSRFAAPGNIRAEGELLFYLNNGLIDRLALLNNRFKCSLQFLRVSALLTKSLSESTFYLIPKI